MATEQEKELRARIDKDGYVRIPLYLRKKYGLNIDDEVFFRDTNQGFEVKAKDQPTRLLDTLYLVGGLGSSHPWDGASYLIAGPEGSTLIDCGSEFGFENMLENIRHVGVRPEEISTILLTHCHYDHSAAAPLFQQHFGTKIVISELGRKPIEEGNDKWTASYVYRKMFPKFIVDQTLQDGQVIRVGETDLTVISLPGHCPDNTAFYGTISGAQVCFVGDIVGGHSENWFSSVKQTKESILKLQKLDIDILCHGHLVLADKERIGLQIQTWWEMAQDAWFDYMLYDRL